MCIATKAMKIKIQNPFAVNHSMSVLLAVCRRKLGDYRFHSISGPNTPCQESSFALVSGNCRARPR